MGELVSMVIGMVVDNSIVIGADKMAVIGLEGGDTIGRRLDKLIQVGNSTLLGIAGTLLNIDHFIELIKNHAKELDKDILSIITLKKDIKKTKAKCGCILAGFSKEKPYLVTIEASGSIINIAIESTFSKVAFESTVVGESIMNKFYGYLDYFKHMNKPFGINEAVIFVYIMIREASAIDIMEIGSGVDLRILEKNSKGVKIIDVDDAQLNLLESVYAMYRKRETGTMVDAAEFLKNSKLLRNEYKEADAGNIKIKSKEKYA